MKHIIAAIALIATGGAAYADDAAAAAGSSSDTEVVATATAGEAEILNTIYTSWIGTTAAAHKLDWDAVIENADDSSYDLNKSKAKGGLSIDGDGELVETNVYYNHKIVGGADITVAADDAAELRKQIKKLAKRAYAHGYDDGYKDGFKDGYAAGYSDAMQKVVNDMELAITN